ncbi:MAG: hypothetical protein HZC41_08485 [Chloroflexi bacterium]|nr:hypothetical protein [Chloroflexota bacterium]
MSNSVKILGTMIIFLFSFVVTQAQIATEPQPGVDVHCGDIVQGEFTDDFERHDYYINLVHGDSIMVEGRSLEREGLLQFMLAIVDPDGTDNLRAGADYDPSESPRSTWEQSLSRGQFSIVAMNSNADWSGINGIHWQNRKGGVGKYELHINCTLRDGTVVRAGDVVAATPTSPASASLVALPPNVPGFPGLAPIDMSNAVKLPLILDTPMTGIVTPTGNEVLGFTLDANANDTVELSFKKLSGNLNLGVVVLSPENKVVFYGGLVLSESLSTRFKLPLAGQYTIGVFRVDLLPPDVPEATAFQVQGTIVS